MVGIKNRIDNSNRIRTNSDYTCFDYLSAQLAMKYYNTQLLHFYHFLWVHTYLTQN